MGKYNSVREQLMYSAILQVFIIIIAIIVYTQYISVKLEDNKNAVNAANAAIEKFHDIKKEGVTITSLEAVLKKKGNSQEIIAMVNKNTETVKKAIQKDEPALPYIDWITKKINKNQEAKDKQKEARKQINSIIPTLSPINDEESITMGRYVTFIEQSLLKYTDPVNPMASYFITSMSPIGIEGIKIDKEEAEKSVNPIGYFDIALAFEASNRDIRAFLERIKKSGDLQKLNEPGAVYAPFTEPLITVQSFSTLENVDKSVKMNSGKIVLRFYIRGASKEAHIFLTDYVINQKNELKKAIATKITECNSPGITTQCDIKKLENFQAKFAIQSQAIDAVLSKSQGDKTKYMLKVTDQLRTLKKLKEEFERDK